MIHVKGTKNALPETGAAQRYVLKSEDNVSRTPLVVGGLLMGVAAYLGSIFSWGRQSEPKSQQEGAVAVAAETENPDSIDQETASPSKTQNFHDSESPSSPMPSVADAPRSMALRYPSESEGVSLLARPANGNVSAEKAGRVSDVAGTPPADLGNFAGYRPPLGGVGPSFGGDPSVGDGPSVGGDSSDGDGSTEGDPLEPEGDDDDVCIRPSGNRAPRVSGPVCLLDVAPCAALLIVLEDLLSTAEDPDGDVLSVQNLAVSSGTLTEEEGGWVFQSGSGQPGPVTLTYQITDGELTIDAVAYFSVVEQSPIVGTPANDTLLGSMCADEIDGGGGNDNIDGRGGDDVITGGAGDDHIVAGDGDDVVFGGDGDDIIFGGAGNDHLFGGSGDDRLFGGDGDDVLFGNDGDDYLSGGDGDDLLLGGDGADTIYGDAGDDTLFGGAGDDRLYGGAGHDVIDGGDGNDVIFDGAGRDLVIGGRGNDWVVAALDAEDDVYDGGEGSDTLDYSHATEGLVIDLVNGVASGVEIGRDSFTGFEKLLGGRGADLFILGGESTVLTGGPGDDVFAFASTGGDRPHAVSHMIMDFGVGDRIRISEYDIFWQEDDEEDDRFDEIYHSDDDHDWPIRYRHDRDDGSEWTVIETDFEDNAMWATTVTLQGIHTLSWSKERDDGLEWLS